jgi:hypothetical protein
MSRYFLLVFYVAVSLLLSKEFHPFARFPMYSSFPNYSYAFYLKDESGNLLPFRKGFKEPKDAGHVAHQYNAFFEYHQYNSGFGEEDTVHLKEAGKELMGRILQGENAAKLNFKTVSLYRRFYHLQNDSIIYRDDLLYEQVIKP